MTPDDPRPRQPDPDVPDAPADAPAHGSIPAPFTPDTGAADGPAAESPAADDPVGDSAADGPTPHPGAADGPAADSPAADIPPPAAAGAAPGTPDEPTVPGSAPPPGPDDVDGLASALVDGLLGPDDAARHRPDVVARAAHLESVRGALRAVPAADPTTREQTLAAALAAFDEQAPSAASPSAPPLRPPPPVVGEGGTPDPAVDLGARRRSGPRRAHAGRQGLPRWFGAAAAAVVVLAGLVGLAALSSGGDDDANTAMDTGATETQQPSGDDSGSAAEDSAEAPSSAGPEESRSPGAAVEAGDLGMFTTGDALVDHLRESLGGEGADLDIEPEAGATTLDTDRGTADAFARCEGAPPPPLDDPGATRVLHGRAVVDGEAVDVWALDTARGRRVVAIDTACELVLDRPLR